MELKVNKYIFNVTNRDWILDNGACYQCMTLKHSAWDQSVRCRRDYITIMSKKQFKQLLRENKLVDVTEYFHKKYNRYNGCKIWRFNVEDVNNET